MDSACVAPHTVFVVMMMWTIDKFVRREHAAGIFEHFYAIGGIGATCGKRQYKRERPIRADYVHSPERKPS